MFAIFLLCTVQQNRENFGLNIGLDPHMDRLQLWWASFHVWKSLFYKCRTIYHWFAFTAGLELITLESKCVFGQFLCERDISHKTQHVWMECVPSVLKCKTFVHLLLLSLYSPPSTAMLFSDDATYELCFCVVCIATQQQKPKKGRTIENRRKWEREREKNINISRYLPDWRTLHRIDGKRKIAMRVKCSHKRKVFYSRTKIC